MCTTLREEGGVDRRRGRDQRVRRVVDGALELQVDLAPRQDEVLRRPEREDRGWSCVSNWPLLSTTEGASPDGFGSTEAEITELTMLPAIRPVIVPPFWAQGSRVAVSGETRGCVIVGGGRAEEDAAAGA